MQRVPYITHCEPSALASFNPVPRRQLHDSGDTSRFGCKPKKQFCKLGKIQKCSRFGSGILFSVAARGGASPRLSFGTQVRAARERFGTDCPATP